MPTLEEIGREHIKRYVDLHAKTQYHQSEGRRAAVMSIMYKGRVYSCVWRIACGWGKTPIPIETLKKQLTEDIIGDLSTDKHTNDE